MLKRFPKTLNDLTGYVVYEPDNYDKTKQYPIVFLFHGQGERGDGSEIGLSLLFDFINNPWNHFMSNLKKNNVILIAPQLPWNLNYWPLEYCTDALKFSANYSVDQSRKYLMGISLGGGIAWGYPKADAVKGQEFAAIIAICCVGAGGDFRNVKSPVWAFHGANDGDVSPQNTKAAIEAIKISSPPQAPKYTELKNQAHAIWGLVLDALIEPGENQTAWQWMLSQKKEVVAQPPGPAPAQKEIFCEIDLNDGKMFTLYMDKSYELK